MSVFTNNRIQRAVGQGFFHTASLVEDDQLRLRYIYDCGAKSDYEKERGERIDELLAHTGKQAKLDILFLSHIHEDHVNGAEKLLDKTDGLKVDTIVLPLLPIEDRLIAFGRSITDDQAANKNAFFRDLIVDPAAALARFGPRRILFVRRGSPDDGAPGRGEGPIEPVEDGERPRPRLGEDAEQAWKLVGTGSVEEGNGIFPHAEASDVRVSTMPDSIALAMPVPGAAQFWLLAPFVDPMVEDKRAEFLDALAEKLKMPVDELEAELCDTAFVQDLVVNKTSKLKQAYGAIAKDLNITSLSLFSGPARSAQGEERGLRCHFGRWSANDNGRIAWLGTGDAALKQKSRRTAFLDHYGQLLGEVATLTMPHHGSDHNFHPELLSAVGPSFCVVAADKYSTWNHPGAHMSQAIASSGRFLSIVTSNPASTVSELAWILA